MENSTALLCGIIALPLTVFIALALFGSKSRSANGVWALAACPQSFLFGSKSRSANSKEFIPEKKAAIKEKVSFNGGDIERLLKLVFSGITAISLLTIAIILFGVCVHYYKGVGFYLETDLYVPSTISIESIRAPIGIDYINRIGYSDTIDVNADVTIKNLR